MDAAAELLRTHKALAKGDLSRMALAVEASLLVDDFVDFVRGAWPVLEPGKQMAWGWALEAICEHLVAVTDGHIKRLLINVPPGMMKSLLVNVFWPAWEWADPKRRHLRYLGTAHKQDLAVRDNMKCRRLIQSAWYQARWPVRLTSDQNAKCLVRGTAITMADGSLKNIEDVAPDDAVLSYDEAHGELVVDRVKHAWCNGVKPVRRVTLSDGTVVTATLNHRFYSWDRWIYVEDLQVGDVYSVLKEAPPQADDALSAEDATLLAPYMFGKRERFEALLDYADQPRRRGGRNATIPPDAFGTPGWVRHDSPLLRYADAETAQRLRGPLDWRRVISIEDVGEEETWHLETERTHLFFAEGLLSHNTKFENDTTGFREAMAFTSMTGSRGDRILLDDPLSVDGANSEADLAAAETTFTEALPTRVNDDDSAIIVIMQRLHEEDTSGIIIDRKLGYEHLMLPMEFEPERRCVTSIGFKDPRKKDGELLFPERFSAEHVASLKTTMGSYAVAGQLQQRPTPRGGGMFKDKHLQLWPANAETPDLQYIVQSYDTAFTDKTANDPTACTVWGVFRHPKRALNCAILLDAWDEHMGYPALRKRVIDDWTAEYGGRKLKGGNDPMHPPRRSDALLVEDKGSGISLLQDLRAAGAPAQGYNPGKADKFGRASQTLPLYELDLFYVLESRKEPGKPVQWAQRFATQLSKFGPGVTAHDDYVDTMTQAAIFLRDQNWLALPSVVEPPEEERDYRAARPRANPYS